MHVHVGMENYINSDYVFAIAKNKGSTIKKLRQLAEKNGKFMSLAGGDATRALIIMDNGVIFGSCVTSKTLCSRFNLPPYEVAASERIQSQALVDDGDGENDEFYLDDSFAPESEEVEPEDDSEDEGEP